MLLPFCRLQAQQLPLVPPRAEGKLFTLEDLNFGGTNYHNLRPQTMQITWWGDQLVHTDVEQCSLIDPATGKETTLFTLDDINRWVDSDDLHYVRHLQSATFPYPGQPIVAVGTKRAFTLVDFKEKRVVWQDSLAGQQCQTWNPKSRATAYKESGQLWVVDAEGHKRQLTTDGSREIVYGESVHRNEWGINEGLFWSPDGQRIAFYRMDQSMVTDYPQVSIDHRIAQVEPDKYPMAGMESHQVTVGVYDLRTQRTVYLDTDTPRHVYYTNIRFSPDGKYVYMMELPREQDSYTLTYYNAETGERVGELFTESDPKYVEPQTPIQFVPWASWQFVFQSQRDGYNHLYLYDIREKKLTQLTSGQWVVMEMLGFDEKDRAVVYAGNERHPLQRNIYAVSVKTRKRTLLDNGEGVHYARFSATGQCFYDKYSTPTQSNVVTVTKISGLKPKVSSLLTAPDPWQSFQVPQYECGTIKAADGTTDLFYRMVKPADFSPTKKYPTVVYVYGGPHAHNVSAAWHYQSRSWETYMAQRGYILFILDNRGSENRGRDFEQATFRRMGQVEMEDQMKGVEYLRSLPYVDIDRLGVHGWSYGGFMTISLMTHYPDVFKVGVAGGPVIDWKWYEVMYGERYMDTPQTNADGYGLTSLIPQAKNLKGRLQIIIGGNDPTCVPQHTLSFLKACVEAGTQPDLFVYPGEGHNMMGHASVHLHERITRYFDDYLK